MSRFKVEWLLPTERGGWGGEGGQVDVHVRSHVILKICNLRWQLSVYCRLQVFISKLSAPEGRVHTSD